MNEIFTILIYDNHEFAGVPEILDILACIISGLIVPLREEHIMFFHHVIIPLHKVIQRIG